MPRLWRGVEALVGDAECREARVEEVGVAVANGVELVAGYGLVELGAWEAVAREEADEGGFEVERVAVSVAPRFGVRREVRRPGYPVRRVVSSAAVTRRRTWASLRRG